MSYDITAEGHQDINGESVKVFVALERETGRVLRQTSRNQNLEEIGMIDRDTEASVHAQFEAITGMKPNSHDGRTFDETVQTQELDPARVTRTAPRRVSEPMVANEFNNPVMPVIGKSEDPTVADVDKATVTSDPADPSMRPTEENDVAKATAERKANEAGMLSVNEKRAIAEGEQTPSDPEPVVPFDGAVDNGEINIMTGERTATPFVQAPAKTVRKG